MSIERALMALGATGWVIIGEPSYENIQWQDDVVLFSKELVTQKIAEIEAIKKPDPLGFRDKLYGLKDPSPANTLFHQVYVRSTLTATNPATASAALTEARNILEGSLWNEPFSKAAFFNQFGTGSFNILSNFLSPDQVTLFESEARNFGLID